MPLEGGLAGTLAADDQFDDQKSAAARVSRNPGDTPT
jgi:hypothetical protein